MRIAAVVSALVHLLIGILLLVTIPHKENDEQLPPPAAVTMQFERGRATGPTAAQTQPDTTASATQPAPEPATQPAPEPATPPAPAPATQPAPPAPETALPVPPMPPPPTVEAKPVPAPPPQAEPPPTPTPPSTQIPAPVTPAEPPAAAQPTPPAVTQPQPVTPPPPAPEAEPLPPQPLPLPPAPPPPRPALPPKLALPRLPPPVRRAAPPKPTDFPPPMNFSFGGGRLSPSAQPPAAPDFSIGPAKPGPDNSTPFGDIEADKAGPDWRNALSRWVSEHAFYPPEARRNDEEGTARVHVVAQPGGKVTSVELVGRSGSIWLDAALQALFRDARIPPLPSGMTEPMEFTFTMHYILIRR